MILGTLPKRTNNSGVTLFSWRFLIRHKPFVNFEFISIQLVYYDDVLEKCGDVFGMDLKCKYKRTLELRRMIHY